MKKLLMGERVRLTSIREEDVDSILNWFNDAEFMRNYDFASAIPQSRSQIFELIDYYVKSGQRVAFAIRDKETDKIIGLTGFDDIHWNNAAATTFIGIGEDEYKGKGYGREAFSLALEFGFYELNFHRIQLNVIAYNDRAIKMYESLGFIREGVFREFIQRDGKRIDLYLYGLLRSEWECGRKA